jgi:hypothetical protein
LPKGLVGSLLRLCWAVLQDCSNEHPTLRRGFERDFSRLESLSAHSGEKVFTLLLPDLGSILESCLETGVLACHGKPLTRAINGRSSIPRLFQGLWRRIVHHDGSLRQDIDPRDIFLLRTLCALGKKVELDCAPAVVYKTVQEYYDVDSSLPPPSQIWRSGEYDSATLRSWSFLDHPTLCSVLGVGGTDNRDLLARTQRIGDRVSCLLGEFLPHAADFRHGPGAVSDLRTGLAYKYAFPNWGPRLASVFPPEEYAQANLDWGPDSDSRSFLAALHSEEPASKLCVVPKTQKAPRLIAAEPTANQWCQQAVANFLTVSIRHTCLGKSIDFKRQDLSGALACEASLTKKLATVDLSSASDRLSTWLIERLFRANYSLMRAFTAVRTRYIVNGIDKKSPKVHELRKFASMGSALTFPIQSIVFYVICVAAGCETEGLPDARWREAGRRVRVYGDDLIVPVEWMPRVRSLMKLLYLKINDSKTFVEGNFRESCGVDAYKGVDVTPIKVKRFYAESAPSTLQSVVDTSNNFFKKGLLEASKQIIAPIPPGLRKLIPWIPVGSGSFGLYTSSGFSTTARKRWNRDLHFWEYETLRFRAKADRTQRHEGFENLLQYFTEDPSSSPLSDWLSGVYSKPTTRMGRGWEAV